MTSAASPLVVDLYELTMVDAEWCAGMAQRPATFSLFVRDLPPARNVLIAAGLDDCLTWLEDLRFGPEELDALDRLGVFEADFLAWLGGLRFSGDVRAVAEGTTVFGEEPILEVDAPLAEAQIAETYLLNQITLQTVLASKAARIRHAAGDRPVVDFALRRTPGIDAGMKLARVGRIVGLDATSNVAGALRYDLAASGTMAHAFVQAHEDETEAFRAYAAAHGDDTVLLVDTYDTPRGIERAVEVALEARRAGVDLRGIRLDSGDLVSLARLARARLDEAGLEELRIIASGGLDEHAIAGLVASGAPIDGFGVGTALGASTDAPSLDTVYKLVAIDGRPVRKTSEGKATWPGAKQIWRLPGHDGDVLALADEPAPHPDAEALLEPVMVGGRRTEAGRRTLVEANDRFCACWDALADQLTDLRTGAKSPVRASDALVTMTRRLEEAGDREVPT